MRIQNCAVNAYGTSDVQGSFGSLLLPLFGVLLVIFLTYIVTRGIAKKYRKFESGKCVRVIERTMLGKDRELVTVETQGQVYVLGVTGGGVTVIATYGAENLPKCPPEAAPGFAAVLDAVKKSGAFIKIPPFHSGGKDEAGHQ
jgi:flagellar biogenesis protein FliO